MEYTVIHSDLKTSDIKPRETLRKYREMIEGEVPQYFPQGELHAVACPACQNASIRKEFAVLGMNYQSCEKCFSLYVNPRPSQEAMNRFFKESKSRQFWNEELAGKTQEVRRRKLIDPLIEWVEAFCETSSVKGQAYELSPSHPAFFRAWCEKKRVLDLKLVEPVFSNSDRSVGDLDASCLNRSSAQSVDAIFCFDVLGRMESPRELLQWSYSHLKKDGLCFLTTVFSTGLSFLVLGEKSDELIPTDRLNLLSFEGIQALAQEVGFEVEELSTPGVLDLEHLLSSMREGAEVPEFFHYLLTHRKDSERLESFQDFLQKGGLSSRGRMVLRKTR